MRPLDKALAAPRANDPASADSLLSATLACIEAEMSLRKDEELAQIAAKRMTSLRFSGPEAGEKITRTARTLADAELPATASRLLASALAMDDAIEVRSGATHELAGRLALQLGRVAAARESLTAAVSFEDGISSAERLARIEWIHGTPGRAIAALAAAPKLTDPALALLLGSTEAARLTKERIAADPEDLLAAFAFALVSAPNTDRMAIEVRQCSLDAQRSALLACTQLEDELLEKTAVYSGRLIDSHYYGSERTSASARAQILAPSRRERQRLRLIKNLCVSGSASRVRERPRVRPRPRSTMTTSALELDLARLRAVLTQN